MAEMQQLKETVVVMAYSQKPAAEIGFREWWGQFAGVNHSEKTQEESTTSRLVFGPDEEPVKVTVGENQLDSIIEKGYIEDNHQIRAQKDREVKTVFKVSRREAAKTFRNNWPERIAHEVLPEFGVEDPDVNTKKVWWNEFRESLATKVWLKESKKVLRHQSERSDSEKYEDTAKHHAAKIRFQYKGGGQTEGVPSAAAEFMIDHLAGHNVVGRIRLSECKRRETKEGDCVIS